MNIHEIILDILGVIIVILSLYGYFFAGFEFYQCTLLGLMGLALFVLKESKVRGFITKYFDSKIK